MEVLYKTRDGRFQVKFEGTHQEIFEQISTFEEVFGENVCVAPDGTEYADVRYVVREDKDENKYYEKVCMDKPAKYRKLAFGVKKRGGFLFPKRARDDDGKMIGWNGWGKYNKETGEIE